MKKQKKTSIGTAIQVKGTTDIITVDLSKAPDVYQTNNPKYFLKWCIDYAELIPDSVPTIAPFPTKRIALSWLQLQHGAEQMVKWYGKNWRQIK